MIEILSYMEIVCNFRMETLIEKFAENEFQYTNTITDETYIKALTGNYKLYFFFEYQT